MDRAVASLAGATSTQQKRTLMSGLAQTRDPRCVDALMRQLSGRQTTDVRAFAAGALGRLGAGWSVAAVVKLLSDRSAKLRSAARKSLAKLCRAPGPGTRHYLRIVTPRDGLPKRLLAGRFLLLSLAKTYEVCPECVLRWPGCPGAGSGAKRRLMGFEIRPMIKVSKSGGTTSLRVSLMLLTHPKQRLKGTLNAKATFDVDLSRPLLMSVLQSLTDSLKGNVDRLMRRVRRQAGGAP